jgi:osmoprotectant transport system permease protein
MNLLWQTVQWLGDPSHWGGAGGIGVRLAQHVWLTLTVVVTAASVALPVGAWMGHTRRGDATVAATLNASRALPTLGLVTLFALGMGIGIGAPVIALVILAMPSIVAAASSGIRSASLPVVEAARALGLTSWQTLTRVEIPLALPVIAGGLQAALLQVVATATIAAYVADVGLGRIIFAGLRARDYPQMLAGAALVILLALALSALASGARRLHRHLTHERSTP